MPDEPVVDVRLSADEAAALHAALEKHLESGQQDPHLERAYRLLGWRMLAATGGSGLTSTIASLAREARTLEDYEAARRDLLDPILEGLERGENRDP